jgi:hypothetical protein
LRVPGLQLPTGDQGSKCSDVLTVGSTIPTPPATTIARCVSRLEGDGVRITSILLERGEDHLGRCHHLNQIVADDLPATTTKGDCGNSDNSGSSGALVRRDAHSNPRPAAINISGRRGW